MPFAKWLTSKDNIYFQRAIVNRVWGNFMGRGIVDPVDDVRATNPASNEELFDALCKDFVDHGFDVKHLIRTIMNSAAYQLASEANATNQNDNKYYSKYIVKRLPAEVLLDAMSQVTGVPTHFSGYPAGDARAAVARHAGEVGVPDVVRAAAAPGVRCGGAVERAERGAGAARDQRRHAEQEAHGAGRVSGAGDQAGALRLENSGPSVPVGIQPLSDRRREAADAGRAAEGADACRARRTCNARRGVRRSKT